MKPKIPQLMVIGLFGLLLSACTLFPNSNQTPTANTPSFNTVTNVPTSVVTNVTGKPIKTGETIAAIKTKYGQVVLRLYADKTPNTVKNFLKKANSGFYSNLTFHRYEPGFVIQGGDPKGTGSGGGSIKSELTDIPFKIGSIGLARTPADKNVSNDSQFFICLSTEACSSLTGDYVNFGEVVSGMDVVQQLRAGDKIIEITQNTK